MCLFSAQKRCIMFFMILRNLYVWENLIFQLWPKMLPTDQITVFFFHQYHFKESINTLHFFCMEITIKAVSEATTFVLLYSAASLVQSDCRILWSSIPLKRINQYLSFLRSFSHQGKVKYVQSLLVECSQLSLLSNQIT